MQNSTFCNGHYFEWQWSMQVWYHDYVYSPMLCDSFCPKAFSVGLSRLLLLELHWLDVPERVQYKLDILMYSCLHGQSPRYLADLCVPVSDVSARQHLRSATQHLLVVPRCRLSTLGPRAFSVAGPSLWNSLPDSLRDPDLGRDNFGHLLKTHLFTLYWSIWRIRDVSAWYAIQIDRLTNCSF